MVRIEEILSSLLVVPGLACAGFSLLYSVVFVILAQRRGALRSKPSPQGQSRRRASEWLIVIPALDHPQLLERCVRAAQEATKGTRVQIVVALDDGRADAFNRGLEAIRRASDEEPTVLFASSDERLGQHLSSKRLICIPTGRLLPQGRLGGKAAALNLVLALHGRWRESATDRTRDTYFLCLDVDEILSPGGFEALLKAADRNPQAALIQAPKYDRPITRSWFSRAFSAGYSAWFHWEAGWVPRGATKEASSYYGSMGAIKLDELTLTETRIELAHGGVIHGQEVFPIKFAVEDYPFAVAALPRLESVLLRSPIGTGCAPPDSPGVLALWHRWAHGNIAASKWQARQILVGPMLSKSQRIAWIYHSATWYAYVALGLLPLALVAALMSNGPLSTICLGLLCVAASLEWVRRLMPVPRTSLAQRILRLPVDTMLWPVVAHAIVAVWLGLSSTVSRSTPRITGSQRLPGIVIGAYSAEALVIGGSVALAAERGDLLSLSACVLISLPTALGLSAVALDPKLRLAV